MFGITGGGEGLFGGEERLGVGYFQKNLNWGGGGHKMGNGGDLEEIEVKKGK